MHAIFTPDVINFLASQAGGFLIVGFVVLIVGIFLVLDAHHDRIQAQQDLKDDLVRFYRNIKF
jgi:hypothetical protein